MLIYNEWNVPIDYEISWMYENHNEVKTTRTMPSVCIGNLWRVINHHINIVAVEVAYYYRCK